MEKIRIPENVVEGFIGISRLKNQQVIGLAQFLEKLPVGGKFGEIEDFLISQEAYNPHEIVKTIVSFGDLLEGENINFRSLAKNLASSVIKDYSKQFEGVEEETLSENLFKILENSANLKQTLKAYNLVLENDNLLINAKINTDIRLIFNEDMADDKRHGIVIHKLQLTVRSDQNSNNYYITLDNSDLEKMKEVLDRALTKERLIKKDYNNIEFIDF